MFDLHSHILPGIDDGAKNLEMSLDMARAAVANGVQVQACTPHILPGVWDNSGPAIKEAVKTLQGHLDREGIPLALTSGADVHITPKLISGLRSGHLLSLADTRYVLLETPHHVAPKHLDDAFYSLLSAGYVPIFTHPERLGWIGQHYETIVRLAKSGVWMQITAGSLTGAFGQKPKYWGAKMLEDGLVHMIASDCHNMTRRPPILAEGRAAAAEIVGEEEAYHLVVTRPHGILVNKSPNELPDRPNSSTRGSNGVSENFRKTRSGGSRKTNSTGYGDVVRGGIAERMRRFLGRNI